MTPFEQLQAQKILSCYNNNQIANRNIDDVAELHIDIENVETPGYQELEDEQVVTDFDNDNVEKGRKAAPDGTKSKDGKWVKQGGKWVSIKKYSGSSENNKTTSGVNDKKEGKKKIKVNSHGLMSLSNLHGKEFEVEKESTVNFASGPVKYYHVKDENGKIHEVREDLAELTDSKKKISKKDTSQYIDKLFKDKFTNIDELENAIDKAYPEISEELKNRKLLTFSFDKGIYDKSDYKLYSEEAKDRGLKFEAKEALQALKVLKGADYDRVKEYFIN